MILVGPITPTEVKERRMPTQWLTIPDAAKSMSVTSRTVERWIATGRLESKLERGRRFVFLFRPMLSLWEVAARLNVSPSSVRRSIHVGEMKAVKLRGR